MSNLADATNQNVTLNDVQLAAIYYPMLVNLARHKHCLTYSELVEQAKQANSDNPVVQNAIAVSTGRKLELIRIFFKERNLPNLASLIISKTSGECGSGFNDQLTPQQARTAVFAFDWSSVSTDFASFMVHTEKFVTPRTRRKRPEALKLIAAYFSQHKTSLPASIKEQRELIIELLEEGFSEEDAFTEAVKSIGNMK